MLEKFGVKGYKCLHDVEVELGPFNVLIGPNDSGKSSFLNALHGLGQCAQRGLWPVPPIQGTDVTWTIATTKYPAKRIRFHYEGNAHFSNPADTSDEQPYDMMRLRATVLAQLEELASISGPVSIDPREIAHRSAIGSGALDLLIASRGRGTAAYLAKVALGDRDRHAAIQDALRDVTHGRVTQALVGEPNEHGYPLSFRLHHGHVIPASELSSGLLVYLFFLALVHRDDAPRVLLIEEPENGLHPHRIHEVVGLLRTLTARGVQIIMTTHSPEVLSACEPEEVRVFLRPEPGSGTEVHRLRSDFRERMMRRDTLGGIWASEGEDGLLDRPKHVHPIVREPAA